MDENSTESLMLLLLILQICNCVSYVWYYVTVSRWPTWWAGAVEWYYFQSVHHGSWTDNHQRSWSVIRVSRVTRLC